MNHAHSRNTTAKSKAPIRASTDEPAQWLSRDSWKWLPILSRSHISQRDEIRKLIKDLDKRLRLYLYFLDEMNSNGIGQIWHMTWREVEKERERMVATIGEELF